MLFPLMLPDCNGSMLDHIMGFSGIVSCASCKRKFSFPRGCVCTKPGHLTISGAKNMGKGNFCVFLCRFYVVRVKGYVWILPEYMSKAHIRRLRVQSKRYVTKVMFLTAVARPIFDSHGNVIFDGKVGMWRVCDLRRRASNYISKSARGVRYRKGDFFVKDVNLGAVKYVEILMESLLPAVRRVKRLFWDPLARGSEYIIKIQHDGAPGHRANGIERQLNKVFACVNAKFIRQPPKSPESNMLDLCVFNSLAATVAHYDYSTKDELVAAVFEAWTQMDENKLELMWAIKAVNMFCYVKLHGREFDQPHFDMRTAMTKGGFAAVWDRVTNIQESRVALNIK